MFKVIGICISHTHWHGHANYVLHGAGVVHVIAFIPRQLVCCFPTLAALGPEWTSIYHGFLEHPHGVLSLLAVLGVEAFLGACLLGSPMDYGQPVLSHCSPIWHLKSFWHNVIYVWTMKTMLNKNKGLYITGSNETRWPPSSCRKGHAAFGENGETYFPKVSVLI